MASALPVSVIIHTRNAGAVLKGALDSVGFAAEVIVADMASDDGTRAAAEAAGARIVDVPLHPRVDATRTAVLAAAVNEWILVLDADERLADDAEPEIAGLIGRGGDYDAFAFPRRNRFGDRPLEGRVWYPDWQIRLFRKGTVEWSDATHRAPVVLTGEDRLLRLEAPHCLHILHDNYRDLGEFIARQAAYAQNDVYPDDPSAFRFEDCLAEAFHTYRRVRDHDGDGDYSVALATVMAWDRVIRGIIHWDRLGRKTPLPDMYSLPIPLGRPKRTLLSRIRRRFSRRR